MAETKWSGYERSHIGKCFVILILQEEGLTRKMMLKSRMEIILLVEEVKEEHFRDSLLSKGEAFVLRVSRRY